MPSSYRLARDGGAERINSDLALVRNERLDPNARR